jgi:transposase
MRILRSYFLVQTVVKSGSSSHGETKLRDNPRHLLKHIKQSPIRLHRAVPDDATLKQVTVKKEPTGEWFATFGVELEREGDDGITVEQS